MIVESHGSISVKLQKSSHISYLLGDVGGIFVVVVD
jgi:hypothetical protein